jgi:hypothetical protein
MEWIAAGPDLDDGDAAVLQLGHGHLLAGVRVVQRRDLPSIVLAPVAVHGLHDRVAHDRAERLSVKRAERLDGQLDQPVEVAGPERTQVRHRRCPFWMVVSVMEGAEEADQLEATRGQIPPHSAAMAQFAGALAALLRCYRAPSPKSAPGWIARCPSAAPATYEVAAPAQAGHGRGSSADRGRR